MPTAPKILAIETSSRLGSICLATGPDIHDSVTFQANNNHAEELLPSIRQACAARGWSVQQLDQVYVSVGPGSFTGLRIACTVARTLAWSAGLDAVAVPSLEVIASNALCLPSPPQSVVVTLDAKRKQIYTAVFKFRNGIYEMTTEAQIVEPVTFLTSLPQPLHVIGEGILYHEQALDQVTHVKLPQELWLPRAEAVQHIGFRRANRGEFTERQRLQPVYLRLPEAEEVWRRKRGML